MAEEVEKHPIKFAEVHPEFGRWVVEVTPAEPFSLALSGDADKVLESMKTRRQFLNQLLEKRSAKVVSMSSFPTLGEGDFFESECDRLNSLRGKDSYSDMNALTESAYAPDELIQTHNRF